MSKLNKARMSSLSDKIYEKEMEVQTTEDKKNKGDKKKLGSGRSSIKTSTKKSNLKRYAKKK